LSPESIVCDSARAIVPRLVPIVLCADVIRLRLRFTDRQILDEDPTPPLRVGE